MKQSGLQRAINHFGSVTKMAIFLQISPSNIHQWMERGTIPARYVADLSIETGIDPGDLNTFFSAMDLRKGKTK